MQPQPESPLPYTFLGVYWVSIADLVPVSEFIRAPGENNQIHVPVDEGHSIIWITPQADYNVFQFFYNDS